MTMTMTMPCHEHDLNRHGTTAASCLTFEQPVDAALFETCLAMLMEFRGEDLLRVKGIINVAGMDRPMVIHGVQHVFHPPEVLDGGQALTGDPKSS